MHVDPVPQRRNGKVGNAVNDDFWELLTDRERLFFYAQGFKLVADDGSDVDRMFHPHLYEGLMYQGEPLSMMAEEIPYYITSEYIQLSLDGSGVDAFIYRDEGYEVTMDRLLGAFALIYSGQLDALVTLYGHFREGN